MSEVKNRDIDIRDISSEKIQADMFVGFYTGFIEEQGYGGKFYFTEHTQKDQSCADKDVFIIENMCNLKVLTGLEGYIVNTYPMNYAGVTGLPCRVIAKL